jgi:hypothetical protein
VKIGRLSFGVLGLLAACSGASSDPSKDPPQSKPPSTSTELAVIATCGAGKMPRTAPNQCAPVGPDAVPAGFKTSAPEWGFHAVVPSAPCGDTTRAAIGHDTCLPVDDCTAPFPPPDATIVVRSGATSSPGVEPTLAGALAKVASGDTIAIDDGTYEGVVVDRSVNFVGRCASKVIVTGTLVPNDGGITVGIGADGPYKVSVRSINFQNFSFALWIGDGATVTADNSIFSLGEVAAWVTTGGALQFHGNLVDSTPEIMVDGAIVANGGQATVSDSEFRNIHIAIDAYGHGARAAGSELVISERSPEESGLVMAADGAEVDVDRSRLDAPLRFLGGSQDTDVRNPGSTEPSTLRISNSEMLRTEPTDPSGFDVTGGSTFDLSESTLSYRARIAISAENAAIVSVSHSVLLPVAPSDVVTQSLGAGLVLNSGAHVTIDESAILNPGESAILASDGCQISLAGSFIEGTWEFNRTDLTSRLGIGQAISLSGNASLVMTDSTLENNAGVSIWMSEETASLQVLRSAILSTEDDVAKSTSTAGFLAWGGTIDVEDSLVQGIPDTAIAIGKATGVISNTVLGKSSVGFRMMGKSTLDEVKSTAMHPKAEQILSQSNTLVDIASSESKASLPLGDCHCPGTSTAGGPDASAP